MKLSRAQHARFEDEGFLVLEDVVDAATRETLIARAESIVREFDPSVAGIFTTRAQPRASDAYFLGSAAEVRCFLEEDAVAPDGTLRQDKARSVNKIGHALHERDPVFAAFSRRPEIAALAMDLGLAQPLLLQSMYIFKQPFVGGEVAPHQDHTFLWTDPPSVMGLWFALHDATLENGCLQALPGGHRLAPRKRFHRTPEGGTAFETLDPTPLPSEGLVPLEVPAGTCVVLHGLLPHASGANRSARPRHAYSLHMVDARADYRGDNWLQR